MLYIRVDANEIIATGHVMRCLAIAVHRRKRAEETTFIVADERTKAIVNEYGFPAICLHTVWNDMESELPVLFKKIEVEKVEMLFIDSYFVTERYLNELKRKVKVIYLDDLCEFPYPVDVLINYNIYASVEEYRNQDRECYKNVRLLTGCKYVPLRQEFENVSRRKIGKVRSLFLTSGGTDSYNVLKSILEYIVAQKSFNDFEIYVVLGRYYLHKDQLKRMFGTQERIHLLENVSNMSYYMKECDISISAAGSTLYELCACGIPAIVYSIADNQLRLAGEFSRKELIYYVGDFRKNPDDCLVSLGEYLEKLITDIELRRKNSERMQETVDGNGCRRICEEIHKLEERIK